MPELIPFLAALPGLLVGTLLVSRVGSWVETIVKHRNAVAAILHSGPWLLGATIYATYYLLRSPHAPAWDWFFAGVGAAPILWTPILIFLALRRRKP
jgi:hypothetical protein